MGSFQRTNAVNPEGFIRGAARVLIAPLSQTFPTKISDVIVLASGASQYDSVSGWTDIGSTKTGVNIARNNAEETFEVDQVQGDIASQPTGWDMSVGTALAEVTTDNIARVWESAAPTLDAAVTTGPEKTLGLGQPESYTQRRLAVLFQRPAIRDAVTGATTSGKIRAYIFRKVQRTPQDSSFTHQKTGEQATLPIRWKCLADDTVTNTDFRFGVIIDQV